MKPAVGDIGVMQGRLVPPIDGRIQAFPWTAWRDEFRLAAEYEFRLLEWTLDQDRLAENPIMTSAGRAEVAGLAGRHGIKIRSLTADFSMQAPFYKSGGLERTHRLDVLRGVVEACAALGVAWIVLPFVDQGHLENEKQEHDVFRGLETITPMLGGAGPRVVFESDYPPAELRRFIADFPAKCFGVNYDTGNSASLGYDPEAELAAYGARVLHTHVKDRMRGGSTVPLGQGDADFPAVFAGLGRAGYRGDYILQTARAADGDHVGAVCRHRDLVRGWLEAAAVGS